MKLALILALSFAFAGVTLVASADEAAACVPPNCPGFGSCHFTRERVEAPDPVGGVEYPNGIECYY